MANMHYDPTEEAEAILRTHWSPDDIPVDPIRIARKIGIDVYEAQLGSDVSGLIRKLPFEAAQIFIDVDDPVVRQRFTCAHELGHYIDRAPSDDGEIAFVDHRDSKSAQGSDPNEIFANQFAAALLMPRAKVEEFNTAGYSAARMAGLFKVSLEAMRFRLKGLNIATRA